MRIGCVGLGFLGFSLIGTSVEARTWHIEADGSGDAATIQAAIDSATAGDVVSLAPGTYTWTSQNTSGTSMILMKAGITLTSEAGAPATIIDAEGRGRVMLCKNVGSDVVIDGLTIQNGFSPGDRVVSGDPAAGAGIACDETSEPAISDCVIRDNQAFAFGTQYGSGVYCVSCRISNCEIFDNTRALAGGGVFARKLAISGSTIRGHNVAGDAGPSGGGLFASEATVTDCRFEQNTVSGDYGAYGGGAAVARGTIQRSTFVRNEALTSEFTSGPAPAGGGLACGECTISDCVFIDNAATGGTSPGAGAAIGSGTFEPVTITRCTLVGNRATIIYGPPPPPLKPIGGIGVIDAVVSNTIIAWSEGLAVNSTVRTSCSDFYGNSLGDSLRGAEEGGNFSADPGFCATDPRTSLNILLQQGSPCAPGNHPDGTSCGLIGAAPVACTVPVERNSWSRIKSRFR